ncbi:hypothetical protein [Nocardia sp. NPDC057272]
MNATVPSCRGLSLALRVPLPTMYGQRLTRTEEIAFSLRRRR